jgi:hypothetical protein
MLETREIDTVVVVGKTEPQRIFELLGREGEIGASDRRCVTPIRGARFLQAQGRGQGACRVRGLFRHCPIRRADEAIPRTHRAVSRHRPDLPSGMASGRWWRSRHRGAAASGLPKKPLLPRTLHRMSDIGPAPTLLGYSAFALGPALLAPNPSFT